MPKQPTMHGRRLMCGEIVQHDVDLHAGLDARVDVAQEHHEILGAMLRGASREDLTRGDIQRGEEIERAMSEVIVGPPVRAVPDPSAGWAARAGAPEPGVFRQTRTPPRCAAD